MSHRDNAPQRDDLDRTLREVFGHNAFRPGQREIVEHVVAGQDAFVLMPTGGGKSLCYQLPALHRPGTAIVVSPLISLMKDQVDALTESGVAAACLNSSLAPAEAHRALARLRAGELDLLYVAPERLMTDPILDVLDGLQVALFAIDEAHCVSQWGHDFRPEYVMLGSLRVRYPGVPLVALTATADEQTRADVVVQLGLQRARLHCAGFDRPNIRYAVIEKHRPMDQLLQFVGRHRGEAGIVYCLSRRRVAQVAEGLRGAGVSAAAYHAGLPGPEREQVQDAFQRDDLAVVVATVAFGLGIDKPNVRYVVHFDVPKSIESYYQETGRAGRDGLPAEALLLYGLADVVTARVLVESGESAEQVRVDLHKLNAMVGLAEALTCRRRALLGYFGESGQADCGNCDVCLDPPQAYDGTTEAQKVLSCVYRLRGGFGLAHVIDVLRGSETARIRQLGHDRLSTHGVGAELSRHAWISIVRQLIHRGYVRQDVARYSVLTLEPSAWPVLRGEERVTLARPRFGLTETAGLGGGRRAADGRRRPRAGAAQDEHAAPASAGDGTGGRGAAIMLEPPSGSRGDDEDELFERLRALRRRLADERHVPAYVVFSDAALREMATRRPATDEEFLEVNGVGRKKLETYGRAFLDVIDGLG